MKRVLFYQNGDEVEVWVNQKTFADDREMSVGTIRNSLCNRGYWRDRKGGILRYVELLGNRSRPGSKGGGGFFGGDKKLQ